MLQGKLILKMKIWEGTIAYLVCTKTDSIPLGTRLRGLYQPVRLSKGRHLLLIGAQSSWFGHAD